MYVEIKHRHSGNVLVSGEYKSLRDCVEQNKYSLRYAEFRGADLRRVDFEGAYLRDVDFEGADLREVDFKDADLTDVDLTNVDLTFTSLRGVDFTYTCLGGAKLKGADLTEAKLKHTDLRHADLTEADLTETNLRGANLRGAKLKGAYLGGVTGNNREIKNINSLDYDIAYTKDFLQIGCEGHLIEDWKEFDDEEIDEMDDYALEWWKENKEFIFKTIEKDPAGE